MIKALPRENLDRVAELVKRGKQGDEKSDDDIHVDLEKEVREEHMDTLYIVLFVYSNLLLHLAFAEYCNALEIVLLRQSDRES